MQAHVIAAGSEKNDGLIGRCVSLIKVLCFGDSWLQGSFFVLFCLWVLAYAATAFTESVKIQAALMMVPVLVQLFIALFIGMRSAFLLGNSQLHLMGLRKELYISLLLLGLLFGGLAFDPKDPERAVGVGEVGRVELTTLTKEFFC